MAKEFLVRLNCEYSILLPATSADVAMEESYKIPLTQWAQAWAPIEAEEEPSE